MAASAEVLVMAEEEELHKYSSVEFLNVQPSYNNTADLTVCFTVADDVNPAADDYVSLVLAGNVKEGITGGTAKILPPTKTNGPYSCTFLADTLPANESAFHQLIYFSARTGIRGISTVFHFTSPFSDKFLEEEDEDDEGLIVVTSRVGSLETKIKKLEENITCLKQVRCTLITKVDALSDQLTAKEGEINKTKEKHSEKEHMIKSELARLRGELDKRDTTIAQLSAEKTKLEEARVKLLLDLEEYKKQFSNAATHTTKLSAELDNKKTVINKLREDLEKCKEVYATSSAEFNLVASKNLQLKQRLEENEEAVSKLSQKLEKSKQHARAAEEDLDQVMTQNCKLNVELEDKQKALEMLHKDAEENKQAVESFKDQASQLRKEADQSQTVVKALQENLQTVAVKFSKELEEKDKAVAKMRQEMADLRKLEARYRGEITASEKELCLRATQNIQLRQQIEEKEKAMEKLQEDFSKFRDSVSTTEGECVKEAKGQLELSRQAMGILREELAKKEKMLTRLREEIADYQNAMEILNEDLQGLARQLQQKNEDVSKLETTVAETEKELEQREANHRSQMEQRDAEMQELTESLAKVEEDYMFLELKLKETEEELKEREKEQDCSQGQFQCLRSEADSYKESLIESQNLASQAHKEKVDAAQAMESLQMTLLETQVGRAQLQHRLEKTAEELQASRSEVTTLRSELENVNDMFMASKDMNKRLTEEIRAFEQTQGAMNDKHVGLESQLRDLRVQVRKQEEEKRHLKMISDDMLDSLFKATLGSESAQSLPSIDQEKLLKSEAEGVQMSTQNSVEEEKKLKSAEGVQKPAQNSVVEERKMISAAVQSALEASASETKPPSPGERGFRGPGLALPMSKNAKESGTVETKLPSPTEKNAKVTLQMLAAKHAKTQSGERQEETTPLDKNRPLSDELKNVKTELSQERNAVVAFKILNKQMEDQMLSMRKELSRVEQENQQYKQHFLRQERAINRLILVEKEHEESKERIRELVKRLDLGREAFTQVEKKNRKLEKSLSKYKEMAARQSNPHKPLCRLEVKPGCKRYLEAMAERQVEESVRNAAGPSRQWMRVKRWEVCDWEDKKEEGRPKEQKEEEEDEKEVEEVSYENLKPERAVLSEHHPNGDGPICRIAHVKNGDGETTDEEEDQKFEEEKTEEDEKVEKRNETEEEKEEETDEEEEAEDGDVKEPMDEDDDDETDVQQLYYGNPYESPKGSQHADEEEPMEDGEEKEETADEEEDGDESFEDLELVYGNPYRTPKRFLHANSAENDSPASFLSSLSEVTFTPEVLRLAQLDSSVVEGEGLLQPMEPSALSHSPSPTPRGAAAAWKEDTDEIFEDCLQPEAMRESDHSQPEYEQCPKCELFMLACDMDDHALRHHYRVCPMCKSVADDGMSQEHFEQHCDKCCEQSTQEEDGEEGTGRPPRPARSEPVWIEFD